jgi:predicted RNase H-like nuclease (RuvC/YqgF family)
MSPQKSPPGSDDASSPDLEGMDFEQTLQDVERSLLLLKARYAQVQSDQKIQQDLKQELTQVQQHVLQSRSKKRQVDLKRELKQLKARLEETELALESQLFSWSGLREVFWQVVRFGGLGVVIGWLLKGWAG